MTEQQRAEAPSPYVFTGDIFDLLDPYPGRVIRCEPVQLEFDFDRYYCRRPQPCLCSNCTALL